MGNGATTRRKWQSKTLGRRNEKLRERVRVDHFVSQMKNGGSVARIVENQINTTARKSL